jgi:tetratricopeptide (TPR) repeat protein
VTPDPRSALRTSCVAALALALLAGHAACERSAPAPPAAETVPSAPPAPDGGDPGALTGPLASFHALIVERRTGAARVRLRKHLDRHEADGRAAFLFGLSYHREKRYALARPWFERAIRDAPEYPVTHYFLGWALYYLGDAAAARAAFETHLHHDPDEGDSHFALGLVDLDEDRVDDAADRFERAIALQEGRADRVRELAKAYALRSDVHVRRGDLAAARADLVRATALHPDHYAAHHRLYRVCLRLGDDDAAARARRDFMAAHERMYPVTRFPE